MIYFRSFIAKLLAFYAVSMLVISCSSTQELADEGFQSSQVSGEQITEKLPDYSDDIQTLKGKGRAIVSEPENTERVTLHFSSNRNKSLVEIRNNLGIEGGKLLTDGDTLLVYNKVDKYVRKIPIGGGNLSSINRLASLNILGIVNYRPIEENIEQVTENEHYYQLKMANGAKVWINKKKNVVAQVVQPANTDLPYSKIIFDAYSKLDGYKLPRKITIFGAEGKSKIALQLSTLELNPALESLSINLPDDIRIYHR